MGVAPWKLQELIDSTPAAMPMSYIRFDIAPTTLAIACNPEAH